MKKILAMILVTVTILSCLTVPAEAKTDQPNSKTNWQIVKQLCRKEGYSKIKLVCENDMTDKAFWKVVENRRGKSYIVVSKVYSISDGTGYGWYSTKTKGTNYIIAYNKRIPKGKKVLSYTIWNPKTNYCDDILYVVDNLKYR